jgi:hypothetical protein
LCHARSGERLAYFDEPGPTNYNAEGVIDSGKVIERRAYDIPDVCASSAIASS